jgi:hypothetical protein
MDSKLFSFFQLLRDYTKQHGETGAGITRKQVLQVKGKQDFRKEESSDIHLFFKFLKL